MSNFISIKQLMDDLTDHPLLKELSLERVIVYTIEFIRIVGMPRLFMEKTDVLNIKDYRAMLPCDYYQIIQLRDLNSKLPYIYSTDTFHMGRAKGSATFTYKIQGNIIYTSNKEGEAEISYQAMAIDDEGYPLLPDNSSFIRALELYIKKKYFTIQFELSKLPAAVLQNVQQEYAFAVGQCQSDLVRPTIDQMESITNMWNTLIPRAHEHMKSFATNNIKEHIKIH